MPLLLQSITILWINTLQSHCSQYRDASNIERNSLLRTSLVGATNAVGVNNRKSDVKPFGDAEGTGDSETHPEWHGEHSTIDYDDGEGKKVTSIPRLLVSRVDSIDSDSVNQGSSTSMIDDFSISNMFPLPKSKLINLRGGERERQFE